MDTQNCPFCGEEILATAKKCKHCGEWFEEKSQTKVAENTPTVKPLEIPKSEQNVQGQTIIVNQSPQHRSNGTGTAGFILALLGLCFCWTPILNWILWALGLLLSFIGMFKRPRGLAITGFILSLISLIILVAVIAAIGVGLSTLFDLF